jgi:hypothetical protein
MSTEELAGMNAEAALYTAIWTRRVGPQPSGALRPLPGEADRDRLIRCGHWLRQLWNAQAEKKTRFVRLCYIPSCRELVIACASAGTLHVELARLPLSPEQLEKAEQLTQTWQVGGSTDPLVIRWNLRMNFGTDIERTADFALAIFREVYLLPPGEYLWILADCEMGII